MRLRVTVALGQAANPPNIDVQDVAQLALLPEQYSIVHAGHSALTVDIARWSVLIERSTTAMCDFLVEA
jgi:hypothetical protein